MAEPKIVLLEPAGPAGIGLTSVQLDRQDFQSDLPEQSWHIYFEDKALGLTVGVWTTTSMQEAFGPYPGDEFMCILEGQVAIIDGTDDETLVGPGEAFFIQNGIPVSWKQVGDCRKFFMTYLAPDAPTPSIDTVEGGINILDRSKLSSALSTVESYHPFEIEGDNPIQRDAACFTNDHGNMTAGLWESEPFESKMSPFPWHELVQMLEGKVAISDAAGTIQEFSAGDVFFVSAGVMCSWKALEPIKKFYCTMDPTSPQ